MSDIPTRFYSLPNEILLMIFEYINARDLYRSFYPRFKTILQSLDHLHLIFVFRRYRNEQYDQLFASRVDTIIIDRNRTFANLDQFPNVRRLIFLKTSPIKLTTMIEQCSQIEYLSIQIKGNFRFDDLYRRIFANEFPNLKSCVFNKSQPIESIDQGQTAPGIRSLTIHSKNTSIHSSLLMVCPNLHSLNLSILTLNPLSIYEQIHESLQCLTLNFTSTSWPKNEVFEMLFQYVPKLKRLSIERLMVNSNRLKQSDWLGKILVDRLGYLQKFQLILTVCDKHDWEEIDLQRLTIRFKNVHSHRYQSHLLFK